MKIIIGLLITIGIFVLAFAMTALCVVYDGDSIKLLADGGCCPCFFGMRYLVSKESGIWQFCMSKGFTPNVSCYRWEKWFYDIDDLTQCEADVDGFDNYQYRLIESSLKDESELEQFLLDNIKVDVESK